MTLYKGTGTKWPQRGPFSRIVYVDPTGRVFGYSRYDRSFHHRPELGEFFVQNPEAFVEVSADQAERYTQRISHGPIPQAARKQYMLRYEGDETTVSAREVFDAHREVL